MPPFKPAPPNIFQHDRHCQLSDMPRVPWRVGCCVCVVMPVVWYVRGKKNMPRVLWRVGCCVCVWSCQPCGMGKKKTCGVCPGESGVVCVCGHASRVVRRKKQQHAGVHGVVLEWWPVAWCHVVPCCSSGWCVAREHPQRRPEFKPFPRERPAPSQPPRIQTVSNS